MSDFPPVTRVVSFWRPTEAFIYREPWQPISPSENTERLLIGTIRISDTTENNISLNGNSYDFHEVGVHAWVDPLADGVALEVKKTGAAEPLYYFVNRHSLIEKFPNRVTIAKPLIAVLEPTARAVWLNEARAFIPPDATIFYRKVQFEETYGFQTIVWGSGLRTYPSKLDVQRRACDPAMQHVKLYARFRALSFSSL